jgi:outer membrane protein OmpA-like peptidoglycan-associated protein
MGAEMIKNGAKLVAVAGLCLLSSIAIAQVQVTQTQQEVPPSNLVTRSVTAIGYPVGKTTKIALSGTDLMPQASGEAKVQAGTGATKVETNVAGMSQPTSFGTEFLTYVLWAVSPDGRSDNLGELILDKNGSAKLNATTPFQTFSLFVTAEPYFGVRVPSEILVLQNDTKRSSDVKIFPINNYSLMRRSQYEKIGNPLALTMDLKNIPLSMYEARNAVDIAKARGAEKYAPQIFTKAQASLQIAENSLASKSNKKTVISNARQTVQFAEDARLLTEQRKQAERIAAEKAAAAAAAKSAAEAKAAEEAQRQADITAANEARMKGEAQAQAEAAAAQEAALRTKEAAAREEAERNRQAEMALRAQLLDQFNRVLETRDTPRGLVVNMGDVLFATGKYNLRPEAQIALAKLSGIILSHPGLNLAVEGYTDSTGSDEFNMKLSQQRANTVRDYLVSQGLSADTVTAQGFGKADPVESNDTAAGRQKNRRVEIVVSGEVIGVKIGAPHQ